jgi:hypothetical protein
VSICKLALGWIGANTISKLDEDAPSSMEERRCTENFGPAVMSALEEKPWLFATGSRPLDLGAPEETGDPRFPVRFLLPPEVVSVRFCDDGSGDYDIEWERRGEYVVSEQTDHLYAIATVYRDNPADWTPTFCTSVAYLLASRLAGPLAPDRAGLAEKMEARYEREIKKAGVFDLSQSSGRKISSFTPLMSRR